LVTDSNLKRKVEADQRAVRRLGFDKRAEDFEEWEKLLKEKKRDLEAIALDNFLTTALASATAAIGIAKSQSRPTATKMVNKLRSVGIQDPEVYKAIRILAYTAESQPKQKLIPP